MILHTVHAVYQRIETESQVIGYKVECTCGWFGVWALNKPRAVHDFQIHQQTPDDIVAMSVDPVPPGEVAAADQHFAAFGQCQIMGNCVEPAGHVGACHT